VPARMFLDYVPRTVENIKGMSIPQTPAQGHSEVFNNSALRFAKAITRAEVTTLGFRQMKFMLLRVRAIEFKTVLFFEPFKFCHVLELLLKFHAAELGECPRFARRNKTVDLKSH